MGAILSCLLTALALGLFALAQRRHHRHAFGGAPTRRQRLVRRGAATALLVVAPIPWILQQEPSMALVTWIFCGTPVAGLAVVGACTVLDRRAQGRG